MSVRHPVSRLLPVPILAIAAGCVPVSQGELAHPAASSPIVRSLKLISAGHTGCLPDDNAITNIESHADGSGLWNATCRGTVYLCTTVATVGESATYSCAPAVDPPRG